MVVVCNGQGTKHDTKERRERWSPGYMGGDWCGEDEDEGEDVVLRGDGVMPTKQKAKGKKRDDEKRQSLESDGDQK